MLHRVHCDSMLSAHSVCTTGMCAQRTARACILDLAHHGLHKHKLTQCSRIKHAHLVQQPCPRSYRLVQLRSTLYGTQLVSLLKFIESFADTATERNHVRLEEEHNDQLLAQPPTSTRPVTSGIPAVNFVLWPHSSNRRTRCAERPTRRPSVK